MSTKKRKTVDDDESDGSVDEPPKKKQKLKQGSSATNSSNNNSNNSSSNSNSNNSNDSKDSEDEKETNNNNNDLTTLESIESLMGFDPNDSQFDCRYAVYKQFERISEALFNNIVLVLKNPNNNSKFKLYQFVEVEYYLLGFDGIHCDVFAHADDLQYETSTNWYFHKAGNNSVEGYNHMINMAKDSNSKWNNPRKDAGYRGGSFKGMDITFAKPQTCFGGILVRAIQQLNPNSIHAAFTSNNSDGSIVYSPGDLIEGPSKCVDQILKETGKKTIIDLVNDQNFNLNCFATESNKFMHFDLSSNYNIQSITPTKSKSKSSNDNIFINRTFCSSPRVGLTLNTKSLAPVINTPVFDEMAKLKDQYVMAPYRFIRLENAGKLKKYKALIGLSMCYDGYYKYMANRFDKVHGYENKFIDKPKNDIIQQVFEVTKIATKGMISNMDIVEKSRLKNNELLVEARKWAKLTNASMAQMFGACMDAYSS